MGRVAAVVCPRCKKTCLGSYVALLIANLTLGITQAPCAAGSAARIGEKPDGLGGVLNCAAAQNAC
jgi:hypothetical protein